MQTLIQGKIVDEAPPGNEGQAASLRGALEAHLYDLQQGVDGWSLVQVLV